MGSAAMLTRKYCFAVACVILVVAVFAPVRALADQTMVLLPELPGVPRAMNDSLTITGTAKLPGQVGTPDEGEFISHAYVWMDGVTFYAQKTLQTGVGSQKNPYTQAVDIEVFHVSQVIEVSDAGRENINLKLLCQPL